MAGKAESQNDPLLQLRLRFLARCGDQLVMLKGTAIEEHGANGDLVRVAHSLAGTGGIFGFPELSARASDLESRLIAETGFDATNVRRALDMLIRELERMAE